jgi:hypothetical protein
MSPSVATEPSHVCGGFVSDVCQFVPEDPSTMLTSFWGTTIVC